MSELQVKICGLREVEHARAAVEAGVDFIGFVFAPVRRFVHPDVAAAIAREVPSSVRKVGLFVNEEPARILAIARQVKLDFVQLCVDETPEFCRALGIPFAKSLRVRGPEILTDAEPYAEDAAWCVLDGFLPRAYGGTGQTYDWNLAAPVAKQLRIMVAGGLNAENVGEAIRVVGPWGVDVSSGIEVDGRKDAEKIAAFVAAARRGIVAASSADIERG